MEASYDFDFIIIGSGFGGSVAAHRLTEKGYRVGVIEMGKRYRQEDFPETNWETKKYFWNPALRSYGFYRMTLLRHAWVLTGVGVGGGSLGYANTLLVPPAKVWEDPKWRHLEDWKSVMGPFYDEARRMLGVTTNRYLGTSDNLLQAAAKEQGFGDSFYPTEVGVYFGRPGEKEADPYFGGEGPERSGCIFCGGCMVGCRYNAKNTLDKNYLYFAEKNGAQVIPETLVVDVRPLGGAEDGSQGYEVDTVSSVGRRDAEGIFRARGVVFAGGVLGTVKLLLEARERGSLPRLSDQIGNYVRTNSESIIGVRTRDERIDMSDGIAIGSGFYLDEHTHVEAVRYPNGSDAMAFSATLMAKGQPGWRRIVAWLGMILRHPLLSLRALNPSGWARSTVILLVMQTLDTHLRLRLRRSRIPPFRKKLQSETDGEGIPTYIPAANRFAEKMAEQIDGMPTAALTEILFNVPTTAHILGGASMGAGPEEGVIDSRNRVFNYKNMYVCDGSMIGANLGVNPSLSITALTEHAMSHVPPAAEARWDRTGERR